MYPQEILDAIKAGHIEVVRRWLEEAPRDLSGIAGPEFSGEPLISFALWSILVGRFHGDRSDLLQLLIAHGADVRTTDGQGFGALHRCEYPGEAAILLKHGADIDKLSRVRITPLMMAARHDYFEVTRLLLRSGANLFMVDTNGHDAASHRSHSHFALDILEDNPSRELVRAVKRAGSWKRYVKEPRIALVRLRSLCARGHATPPPEAVMQRLFGAPASSTAKSARVANRPLPNEVFWHILSYWRSSRDD